MIGSCSVEVEFEQDEWWNDPVEWQQLKKCPWKVATYLYCSICCINPALLKFWLISVVRRKSCFSNNDQFCFIQVVFLNYPADGNGVIGLIFPFDHVSDCFTHTTAGNLKVCLFCWVWCSAGKIWVSLSKQPVELCRKINILFCNNPMSFNSAVLPESRPNFCWCGPEFSDLCRMCLVEKWSWCWLSKGWISVCFSLSLSLFWSWCRTWLNDGHDAGWVMVE